MGFPQTHQALSLVRALDHSALMPNPIIPPAYPIRLRCLAAAVILATCFSVGMAQTNPGAAGPSLEVALGRLGSVATESVLVVAPESRLPVGASAGDTAASVSRSYGLRPARFGAVLALVPEQMRVIGAKPGQPDFLASLEPGQALKILLASFDDRQWRQLQSERGFGVSDTRTDSQRQLTSIIVGDGRDLLIRSTAARETVASTSVPSSRRLRLSRIARVYLPSAPGSNALVGPKVPAKYYVAPLGAKANAWLFGARAWADVPNLPKASHLDLAMPILASPLSLAGATTVGELVERVREATGLEIYADVRFARKRILLGEKARTAPARDMLGALTLALTGTFRRVGSAYVLTDDLHGLGARKELWRRFQAAGNKALDQALAQTDPLLSRRFSEGQLYADTSPQALTASQVDAAGKTPAAHGLLHLRTTFGELTRSQQAEARSTADLAGPSGAEALSPGSRVDIIVRAELQLLLPDLEAPASLPGAAEFLENYVRERNGTDRSDAARTEPAPFKASLASFGSRVAAMDLASIAGSESHLTRLKSLGFSALWISVPVDEGLLSGSTSRLQTAVTAASMAGLGVGLIIDPLLRTRAVGDRKLDRTILGELSPGSAEELKGKARYWAFPADGRVPDSGRIVETLRRVTGVDGIVLGRTAAAGYMLPPNTLYDDGAFPVGYTEPARLAFLRAASVDPIDLTPRYPFSLDVDLSLPQMDELDTSPEAAAIERWARWRTDLNESAVANFAQDVSRLPGNSLPLMVRQRRAPIGGEWYGSWTGGTPLPGTFRTGPGETLSAGGQLPIAWARTQSQIVLADFTLGRGASVGSTSDGLQRLKSSRADGVVLDLRQWFGQDVPLDQIIQALSGNQG